MPGTIGVDYPEEEQLFRDLFEDETQREVVIESLKADCEVRTGRLAGLCDIGPQRSVASSTHIPEAGTYSSWTIYSYSACSPFRAVSERNHKETCAGCIVSLTTPTKSLLRASRSVSSRSFAENASSVFLASYFLR